MLCDSLAHWIIWSWEVNSAVFQHRAALGSIGALTLLCGSGRGTLCENNKPTQQQQSNNNKSGAGKELSGARRKFSFLDTLSQEEWLIFDEHNRDDDIPSESGISNKSTELCAVAAGKGVANPTTTPSSSLSC